jgi:outer membrane protein
MLPIFLTLTDMVLLTKKKLLALALATTWLFAPARAQTAKTTWTLPECIEYALTSNLQVKQSALDAETADIGVKEAWANQLPSINASSNYGFSFGRTIDPTENTFTNEQIQSNNYSVNVTVPVFSGFQIQNTIKRNRLEREAVGADVETIKNDLILNIVSAYMQVILSEELLQTARLQLNNTQQQVERTQKLFRAGSVAESNVLEINAQQATDELAIINAQNQKDLAELSLIQLLDLKNVKDFEVVKPDIKDPDQEVLLGEPEEIYAIAQERMPQVRAADLRVASTLKGVDISRGAYYPRLALGGSLSTNYSSARPFYLDPQTTQVVTIGYLNGDLGQPVTTQYPSPLIPTDYAYIDQIKDNRGESVFLSLSIPILNGFTTRYNVSRALVNHKYAVVNTEVVRNQLRQSIQQAYADALASQKKFSATKRQLMAFEQSYKNAEIRFNNGVLNSFDYNVARNNFVRSQSDLIQAKYEYTFKLKVLDFYQGKPLSL